MVLPLREGLPKLVKKNISAENVFRASASFPGKECQQGPNIDFFRVDFRGQKQGPKRAILGHKKFGLLFFFLPLSCSRATSRLNVCKSGGFLEQETSSRLWCPHSKRLLVPSPIDLGRFPGLDLAMRVANLVRLTCYDTEPYAPQGGLLNKLPQNALRLVIST